MKYVVTGAAGFVGSSIVRSLHEREPNAQIVAVDSFTDYYSVAHKRRVASSLPVDVQDLDMATDALEDLFDGTDVIFHQAGQPGVRPSWGETFGIYLQQNVACTQRLLEAMRTLESKARLIYASSSSVYGDAAAYPVSEESATAPLSPYGVTKLAAEHLCRLYTENYGIDTVSLRYFTVYGPGQRPDMAFHKFCLAASRNEEINVFGDGEQIRDFTYIQDVVDANILAASAAVEKNNVLNICGGSSITVNEVLELLSVISGRELRVSRGAALPGDVRRTGGTNERARKVLGWAPRTDVAAGLRAEYHWVTSLPGAVAAG